MAAKQKTNTIDITRIYDAPVKTVWEAWTDPKQVGNWWGPRGFTITTHKHDLRTGGTWDYTMHGPDGVDWPNKTKYLEVEKYSRMVYDHGGNDIKAPMFRVTVQFTDIKGKTKMQMSMALPTVEAAEETRKIIKKAGGNSTWDRLAEYIDKEVSGKERFVINRSFDAPLATVFEVWTNPEHFAKWLAPTGMNMEFIRAEIKPGGSSFYSMGDGKTFKMYGHVDYVEISKPNRIVYTQQFCDENEKIARHPMAPDWPATMLTVVTLTEEGPDRTRVTVQWEPHGAVTPAELECFLKGRGGMTQGWTGSFDKMEDYLAKL